MSMSVVMQSTIVDASLLTRACDRMRQAGLEVVGPTIRHRYYSGPGRALADVQAVQLPGWRREIGFFCDKQGTMHYDSDFEGPTESLGRLRQEYALAAATVEAESMGGYLAEEPVIDEETGLMTFAFEIPEVISA